MDSANSGSAWAVEEGICVVRQVRKKGFAERLVCACLRIWYNNQLDFLMRVQKGVVKQMAAKFSGIFKKWVYVGLPLLAVVVVLAVIFACSSTTKPVFTLASQDKGADANQAAAESNQPPADANEGPRDPNGEKIARPTHKHPAFGERVEERARMVVSQIKGRQVRDQNVLKAMRTVPRHAFVRFSEQRYAYADYPLPIDEGQTISQPYIVAFMTEALKLRPNSKVLEIGTGSGYQAAVCAEIAREVYTIEIIKALAVSAEKRLKKLGYPNVFVRAGDGFFGWAEKAPYDAIIGTAAAGRVPPPLLEQLKPGGQMILPVEGAFGFQHLVVLTKDNKGKITKKNIMPVRFVPMTGEVTKPGKKSKK